MKFLAERFRSDPDVARRFAREARETARLEHRNVVRVEAVGDHGGQPFFVMEYVEGQTLADLVRESRRLPWFRAVEIAEQICDGLSYIHARGCVHRDIKSRNVMLDHEGRVVILDFGVLRVMDQSSTRTVMLAGTPEYMSPEQAIDPRSVDGRSDLYALGVVFFEMVTGRLPFQGLSPIHTMLEHQTKPPPSASTLVADVPRGVDSVLNKALAKDSSSRYRTADELKTALVALTSAPESREPERSRWHRAAILLALLGACATSGWLLASSPLGTDRPLSPAQASPGRAEPAHLSAPPREAEVPVRTPQPLLVLTNVSAAGPPTKAPPATLPEGRLSRSPEVAAARKRKRSPPRRRVASAPKPAMAAAPRPRPAASLNPRFCWLNVESRPPAARLWAGTVEVGKTPLIGLKLVPGSHLVSVEKKGFHRWRRSVHLEAGEVLDLTATLAPKPAFLHVVTLYEGRGTWARIFVDSELVTESHAAYRKVAQGIHLVTARRQGFLETSRRVAVGPGEEKKVILVLRRK